MWHFEVEGQKSYFCTPVIYIYKLKHFFTVYYNYNSYGMNFGSLLQSCLKY